MPGSCHTQSSQRVLRQRSSEKRAAWQLFVGVRAQIADRGGVRDVAIEEIAPDSFSDHDGALAHPREAHEQRILLYRLSLKVLRQEGHRGKAPVPSV